MHGATSDFLDNPKEDGSEQLLYCPKCIKHLCSPGPGSANASLIFELNQRSK